MTFLLNPCIYLALRAFFTSLQKQGTCRNDPDRSGLFEELIYGDCLRKKELNFPMRQGDLENAHRKAAEQIIHQLSAGKNVAFLTLGDPEFYSTFYYVAGVLMEHGYEIEIISGITSFSASAARLKLPLSLGNESVMITSGKFCEFEGTLVVLKAGGRLKEIKEKAAACNKSACLVENYGLPDEKVYNDLGSIPDEAGYFSVVIVR